MRIERDSMGEMEVPEDALYGASTQRAVLNFPISGHQMPVGFIEGLALVKSACATANEELGRLSHEKAELIPRCGTGGGGWKAGSTLPGRCISDWFRDLYKYEFQ